MTELTNLTDRISHLRDRKGGSAIVTGGGPEPRPPASKGGKRPPERRFASDYFMVFVYALLGIAVCTQFVLIVMLEIV